MRILNFSSRTKAFTFVIMFSVTGVWMVFAEDYSRFVSKTQTPYLTQAGTPVYLLRHGQIEELKNDVSSDGYFDIKKIPYEQLSFSGSSGTDKKIAVLVYPNAIGMFDNSAKSAHEVMTGNSRYQNEEFKKQRWNSGFIMRGFQPKERTDIAWDKMTADVANDTLFFTYGYLIAYDSLEGRFYTTFNPPPWGKKLTAEKPTSNSFTKIGYSFWRDLSAHLARPVVSYFVEKGYQVLDLTPDKYAFAHFKPNEALEKLKKDHAIDTLVVIGYVDSSQWSEKSYPYIHNYMGLHIFYYAFVFKYGADEPILMFDDSIAALSTDLDSLGSSEIRFYSKKDDYYFDGVFDDRWLVEKALNKFEGREMGIKKKVRIGGKFFDELSKHGI